MSFAMPSFQKSGTTATVSVEPPASPQTEEEASASFVEKMQSRDTFEWLFPPVKWIRSYDIRSYLPLDGIGGLVMGVMFIPMGLGYASLLGIPLQIGLYTAAMQSFVYFLVGGVACLSMGPVAEVTLMLLGTPGLPDDPQERANIFATMAYLIGFLSLVLAALRGGEIIRNSLARAVGNAYSCAAGVVLIAVQMKDAFNLSAPSVVVIHEVVYNFVTAFVDQASWKTLGCLNFFLIFFGYLTLIKRFKQVPGWVPHQLIAVALSTFLTFVLRLDNAIGLHIVGSVPSEPPSLSLPSPNYVSQTWLSASLVTLVSFLQMYSIATKLQSTEVDATKELMANGCCSLLSGVIGGIPGSSSFSRCLVLSELKAKTTLNSLVASVVVFFAASFFTGLFYYLPKSVLAAIIMAAVLKLVDFSHALWLWRFFPADFAVWATVFGLTLFVGVAAGILSGIIVSTLIVLYRVGRPPSSALGFDTASQEWVPLGSDPELLLRREILVWSFDAPCYFINVNFLTPLLTKSLKRSNRPISVVVISCLRVTGIDSNSVESLVVQLRNLSKAHNLTFFLCHVLPHVRRALEHQPNSSFPIQVFETIDDAVLAGEAEVVRRAKRLFPSRPFPAVMSWSDKQRTGENVVGFVAVVSHGDRSPKQKIKVAIEKSPALVAAIFGPDSKSEKQIIVKGSAAYDACVAALRSGDGVDNSSLARRVMSSIMSRVLVNDAVVCTLVAKRKDGEGANGSCQLIVKWGGTITSVGAEQAAATGKTLVHRLRLANLERSVTVSGTASDEDRVLDTGRLFLQSLCATVRETMPVPRLDIDKAFDREGAATAIAEQMSMDEISELLHIDTRARLRAFVHLEGVKGLMTDFGPRDGPKAALLQAARDVQELIRAVQNAPATAEGVSFADHEPVDFFVRRYSLILAQFLGRSLDEQQSGDERSDEDAPDAAEPSTIGRISELPLRDDIHFQVSKIPALYDNMVYDMVHNAVILKSQFAVDMRKQFPIVQRLYRVVAANRSGTTPSFRFITGALRVHAFLTRLRSVVDAQLQAASHPDAPVRLDCFFTSTSLVEGLRHCIAHSEVLDATEDKGARAALERLVGEGWHYISHLVIKVTRSGDVAAIELLMSPGSSLNHEAAHALAEIHSETTLNQSQLYHEAASALTRVGPLIRVWRLNANELEALIEQIALVAAEQGPSFEARQKKDPKTSPAAKAE